MYDIFNYLIRQSTEYDIQGLAAYKSLEEYRLFQHGYVESLLTETLSNERLPYTWVKLNPNGGESAKLFTRLLDEVNEFFISIPSI